MSPNTKKCPNPACGRENSPNESFCIDCGDELDAVTSDSAGGGAVPPTTVEVVTQAMPGPVAPPRPQEPSNAKNQRLKTQIGNFEQDEEIRLVRLGAEGRPQGSPYVFRDRTEFTIGREKGDILILTDKQVSKTHARVAIDGAECYVENLSETNGVFLRLRANEVYELQDGDELLLATEFLLFRMPPDGQAPADPLPPPPNSVSPQPVAEDSGDFVDGGGRPASRLASGIDIRNDPQGRRPASRVHIPVPGQAATGVGAGAGAAAPGSGGLNSRMAPKKEFKTEIMGISDPAPKASLSRCNDGRVTAALFIHLSRVTFGRENCTFNFPGGKISRQHAEIVVENGKFFLKDLGSQNGTFVRIRRTCLLHNEDQFRVGSACFQLLAPALAQ